MFIMTYDGDLCACPAAKNRGKPLQAVLDIGTGTGLWAIDFGIVYRLSLRPVLTLLLHHSC